VRSLTNDPENRKRIKEKLHTRSEAQKPFGRLVSDHMSGAKDQEIYNDADFYQALLKDFLASNESNGPSHNQGQDDDIYADGADLGMTQRFLDRRRKLKEAG